jgi:hypothetical protein
MTITGQSMKHFFFLLAVSCAYIHPIKKVDKELSTHAQIEAKNEFRLEVNNLVLPEHLYGKDIRGKINVSSIYNTVEGGLSKYKVQVNHGSSNALILDLNKFYVWGGPGWFSCKIDILITARGKIDGIRIPPKTFHTRRRVFFCSITNNDERFSDEVSEMMSENLSKIVKYISEHGRNERM